MALCIVALLAPVLFGREMGWPIWLALPFFTGLLLLWAFAEIERRLVESKRSPLLDPSWLGDSAFATGLLATFTAYSGIASFLLILTLYLQNGLSYSPLLAGLTSGPLALAFLAASRWAASAGTERGPAAVMTGAGIMALALLALAATAYALPTPPLAALSALIALYGFGQGFLMAPLVNTVLSRAHHIPAGAASGVLVTVQQMSGAAGIAIIGLAYFTVRTTQGDSLAFAISAVALCGTAAATALVIGVTRR